MYVIERAMQGPGWQAILDEAVLYLTRTVKNTGSAAAQRLIGAVVLLRNACDQFLRIVSER